MLERKLYAFGFGFRIMRGNSFDFPLTHGLVRRNTFSSLHV
jgi:hypothetical protein